MEVFLARQPVFDLRQNVFGYELLYRSQHTAAYDGIDGDQATLSVIHNTFLLMGLENLTGGRKAFINFTRKLLEKEVAHSLPTQGVVIEILEDVEPDDAMVTVCAALKKAGYSLALDDFVIKHLGNPLLQFADIIKVDLRQTTMEESRTIVQEYAPRGIKLLAEKTETLEEFTAAKENGFIYFQGYFFSKPVIVSRKNIPSAKINHLRMIREINREDLDMRQLETIVKQDTSLTYKLMRYINSPFFGLRQTISSIQNALVLLGEREVRKWASLVLLTSLGQDKPAEVLVTSLARAKLCEALAIEVGLKSKASELFLVGMFSMIDVLIGRPLPELLEEMLLPQEVKDALMGQRNTYRDILDLVLSNEQGDWEACAASAAKFTLEASKVPDLYVSAIQWAENTLHI